ncbi:MAG: hypothetical protein HWD61_13385 [Parachlamydiaceae bacterium]|nr:MAG: hypothetical protein HWD61_13385 [Parachlamydiaceae bacterium]
MANQGTPDNDQVPPAAEQKSNEQPPTREPKPLTISDLEYEQLKKMQQNSRISICALSQRQRI